MDELHEIVNVSVVDDCRLNVCFDDGKCGIFDCSPYFEKPYWRRLAEPTFFRKVRIAYGTLTWGEDIDIGEDDIYDQMFAIINNQPAEIAQ